MRALTASNSKSKKNKELNVFWRQKWVAYFCQSIFFQKMIGFLGFVPGFSLPGKLKVCFDGFSEVSRLAYRVLRDGRSGHSGSFSGGPVVYA